ncbi:MAG: YlbF family regulator [Bacilli bacterium]|nr:YlbF family regulator [Bacilli bacterium]
MNEKAYEIIDTINDDLLVKKLKEIKLKITSDKDVKKLIDDFNQAKNRYEKYNVKDELLKAKKALINNELINRYLSIQKEINMLSMLINQRLERITKVK